MESFSFIPRNTIEYFLPDPYKVADFKTNATIPIVCIDDISTDDGFKSYNFPNIIDSSNILSQSNTTKNVLISLQHRLNVMKTYISEEAIYISRGLILNHKGEILLCLTVKQKAFEDSEPFTLGNLRDDAKNFIGYDNFIMYIASEFIINPLYSAFYRRLQKAYIDYCYLKGVEVRIIPSNKILKNTFANEFKIEFNSISELENCLKHEVGNILCKPDEYFTNHPLFIKPEIPQPEISEILEIPIDVQDYIQKRSKRS